MPKRILQGIVVSDLNTKTVTVSVERRFKHPVLKKTIRKSKKYRAHDVTDKHKVGDIVKVGFDAARCHLFDSSKQAFK